jgi:transposase
VDRTEAESIYDAGREAVVEVLLAMDRRISQLEARVEELERRLRRSSRNSSLPPSSDPPAQRQTRSKDRSGRKQGAQEGHAGRGRDLLPASAIDQVVDHWPESCACGHVFIENERVGIGAPARHQVEELPLISVQVTEYRAHRVACPDCGASVRAKLPAEIVQSAFGPRLQAAITTLSIRNRVSRRDTVELCEELFGARICAGSVETILDRSAAALDEPYADVLAAVRASRHVNADETGWRLRGQQRTLWGAFTAKLALFQIAPDRHEDRAKELFGDFSGILTSDRWWAYNHVPPARRQVCWSHLRRDFQAHAEGLAAEKEFGEAGLVVCEGLFWAWEIYEHTGERTELRRRVALLRRELKPILTRYAGKGKRYKRTRGMARNLLKVWPALWTFATVNGVEPTNNHAERALRGAVIYRKLSLGSQSQAGERRIERLLSASVTCRLQRRSLFAYLSELLSAHLVGDPVPSLA